jgi:hypothetical protein
MPLQTLTIFELLQDKASRHWRKDGHPTFIYGGTFEYFYTTFWKSVMMHPMTSGPDTKLA